jgi:hypothetical protein
MKIGDSIRLDLPSGHDVLVVEGELAPWNTPSGAKVHRILFRNSFLPVSQSGASFNLTQLHLNISFLQFQPVSSRSLGCHFEALLPDQRADRQGEK